MRQAASSMRQITSNAFLRREVNPRSNIEEEATTPSTPSTDATERPSLEPSATPSVRLSEDASEVAEDSEDTFLPQELGSSAELESVVYVVGANLHRLGCPQCKDAMADVATPSSGSFTAIMTYSNAHMINPRGDVVDYFSNRLVPILNFYKENFYKMGVVDSVCRKFRLPNEFPACCPSHAETLLTFFARMVLRTFCKERNAKIKADSKMKKKMSKLNIL